MSKGKVAIKCPTQDIFNKVIKKAKLSFDSDYWDVYKENTCITNHTSTYCREEHYVKEGYLIISAEEYLGENSPNILIFN